MKSLQLTFLLVLTLTSMAWGESVFTYKSKSVQADGSTLFKGPHYLKFRINLEKAAPDGDMDSGAERLCRVFMNDTTAYATYYRSYTRGPGLGEFSAVDHKLGQYAQVSAYSVKMVTSFGSSFDPLIQLYCRSSAHSPTAVWSARSLQLSKDNISVTINHPREYFQNSGYGIGFAEAAWAKCLNAKCDERVINVSYAPAFDSICKGMGFGGWTQNTSVVVETTSTVRNAYSTLYYEGPTNSHLYDLSLSELNQIQCEVDGGETNPKGKIEIVYSSGSEPEDFSSQGKAQKLTKNWGKKTGLWFY